MLAWSTGKSAAGTSKGLPAVPIPAAKVEDKIEDKFEDKFEESDDDNQTALLAGTAATRRRHAVRIRRRSKIVYRVIRLVYLSIRKKYLVNVYCT